MKIHVAQTLPLFVCSVDDVFSPIAGANRFNRSKYRIGLAGGFRYDPGLFGLRTFHTSDLPLTMRMVLQPVAEPLSKRLASAFANFARRGDPNGLGVPMWPRYERTQQPIMIFDRDVAPAGPDPERAARSQLISIVGEQPFFP